MMILACLLALVALAVIFVMTDGTREDNLKRIDRIKKRMSAKPSAAMSIQEMSLRRKGNQPKGLSHLLAKQLPDFKRIGGQLERAGKTITPQQFVIRRIIYLVLITAVAVLVFHKSIVMGLCAGLILGVWFPLKLLRRASDKHVKAFLCLFPDALDLIVRGLRSGLPVSESMVMVSQEVPDPVGSVFGNMTNTMKLGVSLEKALQEQAKKLDMTEFNFFTTSIVLQRETGGNLSEILNNLSEVLRARYMMRMKIKAMSSEARASIYIIGALPFVVFFLVMFISPDYMKPLWQDYRGNICACVAAGMMVFGIWLMRRMSSFEI